LWKSFRTVAFVVDRHEERIVLSYGNPDPNNIDTDGDRTSTEPRTVAKPPPSTVTPTV